MPLADCLAFCRTLQERGLDGLTGAEIAAALGYTNVRTNTFSAAVSSARQFGFLTGDRESLVLTDAVQALLLTPDDAERSRLLRTALVRPPLYRSIVSRFAEKVVPEPAILANVLQRQDHITATAKVAAAEAFLASARFAGMLADDLVLRPNGRRESGAVDDLAADRTQAPNKRRPAGTSSRVRLDLRLWGPDEGKLVRVRAPETMTEESLDRLIQAIRLLVRIVDQNAKPD